MEVMRWDAQRLDVEDASTLPGMPSIRGLLRSVQVPEFPGLTFHEVRSKSALNHVPGESAMPFPYTINPYRGCNHSCIYCYARKTHEWLELDSGHDFDSQIVVKTNLVDVLRKELARPSWKHEHVALGTNTDPYQRAEGRYKLMPGVIRALTDSRHAVLHPDERHPAAQGHPAAGGVRRRVPVGLGVSMAIWDDDLHASLEPGVPTPRARLDLVRAITDAGLPCGVFLAPVLPGLTDGKTELDAALGAIAAAGATGVTVIPLHLRPGAREWFMAWLARAHPELVPRYEQLYARRAYVPAEYRTWLAQRVAPLLAKHGLDRQKGGAARQIAPRHRGARRTRTPASPPAACRRAVYRACRRRVAGRAAAEPERAATLL